MVQRVVLILWGEPAVFWVELISTHSRAALPLHPETCPVTAGEPEGIAPLAVSAAKAARGVPARGSRGHDQTRRHLQDYNTLGGRSGQISR